MTPPPTPDLARVSPGVRVHLMMLEDSHGTHVVLEMDAELPTRTRWMASFDTRAQACRQIEDLSLLPGVDVDRIRATGSLDGQALWLPSTVYDTKGLARVMQPFAVTPWH